MPESLDRDATPPGTPPGATPGAPSNPLRIDRFSYYVLRRLNLGGLLLLATALCTADFLATGNIFWTGVLTGLEGVLAIPWAWTVVSMDRAEARILDTKRLGPPEELARRMQDFAAILHATPPADANAPVLVPGDIELDKLERHRREGIAIDPALQSKLETLAARRASP